MCLLLPSDNTHYTVTAIRWTGRWTEGGNESLFKKMFTEDEKRQICRQTSYSYYFIILDVYRTKVIFECSMLLAEFLIHTCNTDFNSYKISLEPMIFFYFFQNHKTLCMKVSKLHNKI